MELKSYLKARKIPASHFAETLGVKQPTVHRYLHGHRFPSPQMILLIQEKTHGRVKILDWYTNIKPASVE